MFSPPRCILPAVALLETEVLHAQVNEQEDEILSAKMHVACSGCHLEDGVAHATVNDKVVTILAAKMHVISTVKMHVTNSGLHHENVQPFSTRPVAPSTRTRDAARLYYLIESEPSSTALA